MDTKTTMCCSKYQQIATISFNEVDDVEKSINVEIGFNFNGFRKKLKKLVRNKPGSFQPATNSKNVANGHRYLPVLNLDPFVKPGVLKVEDITKPVNILVDWKEADYPHIEYFDLDVIAIGTVGRTFRDEISAEEFNHFLRFDDKTVRHFYHCGEMLIQSKENGKFKKGSTRIGRVTNKGLSRAKFLDYGLLLKFSMCVQSSKTDCIGVTGFGTVDPVIKVSSGGGGTP